MADANPFTARMEAGRCPLCDGTGKLGPGVLCLHEPPRCPPGGACHLCLGTGAWPPPDPGDVCPRCQKQHLLSAACDDGREWGSYG
jgi:hypothetical protein